MRRGAGAASLVRNGLLNHPLPFKGGSRPAGSRQFALMGMIMQVVGFAEGQRRGLRTLECDTSFS